jgi:hypothetical protein
VTRLEEQVACIGFESPLLGVEQHNNFLLALEKLPIWWLEIDIREGIETELVNEAVAVETNYVTSFATETYVYRAIGRCVFAGTASKQ